MYASRYQLDDKIVKLKDDEARKKIEELEKKIEELEARPKIWKGTETEHAEAFAAGEVRVGDFVVITDRGTAGGEAGEGTDTGGTGTDAGSTGTDTGTDAGGPGQEGGMPEAGPDSRGKDVEEDEP